tara:strand:+ start:190 stop:621 length:432 start_codon:yes stop_codon:yes gene_type:complete
MKTKNKHLVFVYGTLREGFNNHYLLTTSKWIDYGITDKKYYMSELGIPFVVEKPDLTKIKGELYEVSDDTLEILDLLEGHPNFYKRKKVNIKSNFSGKIVKAWLYFYPVIKGRPIFSGDFKEYKEALQNEEINKISQNKVFNS